MLSGAELELSFLKMLPGFPGLLLLAAEDQLLPGDVRRPSHLVGVLCQELQLLGASKQ